MEKEIKEKYVAVRLPLRLYRTLVQISKKDWWEGNVSRVIRHILEDWLGEHHTE